MAFILSRDSEYGLIRKTLVHVGGATTATTGTGLIPGKRRITISCEENPDKESPRITLVLHLIGIRQFEEIKAHVRYVSY